MDLCSFRVSVCSNPKVDAPVKNWFLTAVMFLALAPNRPVHANCCLCMCRAKDETTCSAMCIRLQHGKKIVEEPEMNVCTKECRRVHVKPIDSFR